MLNSDTVIKVINELNKEIPGLHIKFYLTDLPKRFSNEEGLKLLKELLDILIETVIFKQNEIDKLLSKNNLLRCRVIELESILNQQNDIDLESIDKLITEKSTRGFKISDRGII